MLPTVPAQTAALSASADTSSDTSQTRSVANPSSSVAVSGRVETRCDQRRPDNPDTRANGFPLMGVKWSSTTHKIKIIDEGNLQ
jgi:hypothetical protein